VAVPSDMASVPNAATTPMTIVLVVESPHAQVMARGFVDHQAKCSYVESVLTASAASNIFIFQTTVMYHL